MDSLKHSLRQSRGYIVILLATLALAALTHHPDSREVPPQTAEPVATVEANP